MEISRSQVEVFMVALFLFRNHGYRFVTIHQHDDELWLGNPRNVEFPVIRISSTTTESTYFDKDRLMQIHHAVLKALKREGRLLDLHISAETSVDTDPDFEQSVLNNGVIYGKNISANFPLIKNAVTSFDDPKEEFARLNRELEDTLAARRKQKKNMSWKGKLKATYIVMALCAAVFLLDHVISNLGGYMVSSVAIALGAYYRNAILVYHQFWRFLTVGLHHISIWHFLMNMLSLYTLGIQLEKIFGWKRFLIILILSTICGSAMMAALDTTVFAVGLSGGLYGCMAAWLLYAYTRGLFKVPAFKQAVTRVILVNLMINLMPNIAVSAHIGGFLGGLAAAFVMIDYKPWKQLKIHVAAASLIVVVFLGYYGVSSKARATLYFEDLEMIQIYKDAGLSGYADRLALKAAEYYHYDIKGGLK